MNYVHDELLDYLRYVCAAPDQETGGVPLPWLALAATLHQNYTHARKSTHIGITPDMVDYLAESFERRRESLEKLLPAYVLSIDAYLWRRKLLHLL